MKDELKSGKIIGYKQKTIRRRINDKSMVIKKMWIRKNDMMREGSENSSSEKKKIGVVKKQAIATVSHNQRYVDQKPQKSNYGEDTCLDENL